MLLAGWIIMEILMTVFFYNTGINFVLILKHTETINCHKARLLFGFVAIVKLMAAGTFMTWAIIEWYYIFNPNNVKCISAHEALDVFSVFKDGAVFVVGMFILYIILYLARKESRELDKIYFR